MSEFGRWDYILEGVDTLIDEKVISLIKEQIESDKSSEIHHYLQNGCLLIELMVLRLVVLLLQL